MSDASFSESLAAIVPTTGHAAQARAMGIDPVAQLGTIKTRVTELAVALRQFASTLPAGDPNSSNIATLIAGLGT